MGATVESLAVIPARGGSERIPRKNMEDLGGRPLIDWTIQAAVDSRLSRVVVSTEDVEIAAYAKKAGVEVVPQPLRSALSGNMSAPVVLSALDFLEDTEDYEPDLVCLLHPTSPFRTAADIDHCLLLADAWPGSVISFTADDLNGAIYLAPTSVFRADRSFFRCPILPYEMDVIRGVDIDEPEDLERARNYLDKCATA